LAAVSAAPRRPCALRALTPGPHPTVEGDPVQAQRLENLDQAVKDKLAELDQTISLRRKGDTVGALSIVRSDHGKVLMDRIRSLVTTMGAAERAALGERQDQWQHAEFISSAVTFGGSTLLLLLIGAAAVLTSRDYRARQAQVWLRLCDLGLQHTFDAVVTFDDTGERKPGQAPFREVLRHLAVTPGEALMIGDWAERAVDLGCGAAACSDVIQRARWIT